MFDTSKKEMLNPNQGYKKFVMKLKQRYSVSSIDPLAPSCPSASHDEPVAIIC